MINWVNAGNTRNTSPGTGARRRSIIKKMGLLDKGKEKSSLEASAEELEERLLSSSSYDEKPNVKAFAIDDNVIEATEIVQTQGNSNGFRCEDYEFFALPLKVFLLMMSFLCCGLLVSAYKSEAGAFNLRSHLAAFTDLKLTPVKHRREILFYGDSLVQNLRTYDDILKDLKTKLEDENPRFDVSISLVGNSGDTVSDLLAAKTRSVVHRKWRYVEKKFREDSAREMDPDMPDAVILYWDSDVMIEDQHWSEEKSNERRASYRKKLEALLSYLQQNIRYVAFAGPGLSGEYSDTTKNPRDKIFDAYTLINIEVSQKLHVPFINIRRQLKEALPKSFNAYEGYFTIDGEHLNRKGYMFIGDLFMKQLMDWSNSMFSIQKDEIAIEIYNRKMEHAEKDVKRIEEIGNMKVEGESGEPTDILRNKPRSYHFDDDQKQAKFERYWRMQDAQRKKLPPIGTWDEQS